jgi:hypothetical protein
MELLAAFLNICNEFSDVFRQGRTARRATAAMLASLLCVGRRWLTRVCLTVGGHKQELQALYKMFSRANWDPDDLFQIAIRRSLPWFGSGPIVLGGDETKGKRGGRKLKKSRWMRDPMSPPFHTNFIKGLRFLQFSALPPLHKTHGVSSRGIPVGFVPVSLPAKPKKNAPQTEWDAYNQAMAENNLCRMTVRQIKRLREAYDEAGAADKLLVIVLDGSFCNETIFSAEFDRTVIVARGRKDAVLCHPANDSGCPRRFYGKRKFTPEQIRQDESIPWSTASVFFGGKFREVRSKEIRDVLWQGGAKRRQLRLLVVAPTGYRLSPNSRTLYREPAWLFTTDDRLPAEFLLQCYLDRWQIEVNHRDEKQQLGIMHPQVWNDTSVDRVPQFLVAAYSFLLLASLEAYGPRRTSDYIDPYQWGTRRTRPSCQDLLNLLRKQAAENPEKMEEWQVHFVPLAAILAAAA